VAGHQVPRLSLIRRVGSSLVAKATWTELLM
jgi:hypothetical protein